MNMDTMSEKQKNEILFMQFVMGLSHSGMMQLGKIMNPMTQKIEKDLIGAQATIDLLTALREKTKGNLNKAEEELLTNGISTLQLNYVDELGEKKEEKVEEPKEEPKEKPKEEPKEKPKEKPKEEPKEEPKEKPKEEKSKD